MIDYAALSALSAVLRNGSFDGAAAELGLTQSAVSQRIKALEDRVGATLLKRTRPPEATEPGKRLLRHAEEVGVLEQALSRDLGALLPKRDAPLRIAVTADSLATFVPTALAKVDGYLFDLVIDDQDFSADLLRKGEVAAAAVMSCVEPMKWVGRIIFCPVLASAILRCNLSLRLNVIAGARVRVSAVAPSRNQRSTYPGAAKAP